MRKAKLRLQNFGRPSYGSLTCIALTEEPWQPRRCLMPSSNGTAIFLSSRGLLIISNNRLWQKKERGHAQRTADNAVCLNRYIAPQAWCSTHTRWWARWWNDLSISRRTCAWCKVRETTLWIRRQTNWSTNHNRQAVERIGCLHKHHCTTIKFQYYGL